MSGMLSLQRGPSGRPLQVKAVCIRNDTVHDPVSDRQIIECRRPFLNRKLCGDPGGSVSPAPFLDHLLEILSQSYIKPLQAKVIKNEKVRLDQAGDDLVV